MQCNSLTDYSHFPCLSTQPLMRFQRPRSRPPVPSLPNLKPPSPAALATLAIVACTAVAITAEARRVEAARQLDRRISELFSLQELSYVLAESIELDRIADQVGRYGA